MELAFIVLILILGAIALSLVAHTSALERQNNVLRQQNQMLVAMAESVNRGGLGCGTMLGIVGVAVVVLVVLLALTGGLF